MAINTMCRGFSKITCPWKAKISTSVSRSPMVVMPSNFLTKAFSKYSAPFFWVTKYRVSIPPARGITTNSTTDNISVSHGTNTFETPSRNFTMGTNATGIMRSLVATCTTVYAGSPLVSALHTKTIAVQGTAPNSTAPARYSVASSGVMNALNTTKKNRLAMPYMVKGLMSQLTIQVTNSPWGSCPHF